MLKRTLTALGLLLIGFPVLINGGVPYLIVMGFLITVAAWEYTQIVQISGSRPAGWLVVSGVIAILVARFFYPEHAAVVLTIAILVVMAYHLLDYEQGAPHSGMDFSVSLGGLVYLGWMGAYLMDMRQLQNGGWWVMFVLPCVWLADSGAYMIGAAYGKHRMTPRLSPKKTWEGFAAGVFTSMITGAFFAFAYSTWGPLNISVTAGAVLGLLLGLLTPLGDLGESMFKRQSGKKDSGNLFPGHGGAFDRIDSWIWAGVIGYYFISWFYH